MWISGFYFVTVLTYRHTRKNVVRKLRLKIWQYVIFFHANWLVFFISNFKSVLCKDYCNQVHYVFIILLTWIKTPKSQVWHLNRSECSIRICIKPVKICLKQSLQTFILSLTLLPESKQAYFNRPTSLFLHFFSGYCTKHMKG